MAIKVLSIITFWITAAVLCDSRSVIMVKFNDLENYAVDILEKQNFTPTFTFDEEDMTVLDICSQLFETRSYEIFSSISTVTQNWSPIILNLNEDQELSYLRQAERTSNNLRHRDFVIGNRTFSLASFPCFDHDGQFNWIVAYDFNLQIGLLFLDRPNTEALPQLAALIDSYVIVKFSSNGSDSSAASSSSSKPKQSTMETMFLDSLAALSADHLDDPLHDLDENSKFRLCSMGSHVILEKRGLKSVNQNAEFKWTIENPNLNFYRPIQNSKINTKITMIGRFSINIDVYHQPLYCHMLIQQRYYGFYLSKNVRIPKQVFVIKGDNVIQNCTLLEQMEVNWLENALYKNENKGLSKLVNKFKKP